MVERNTGYSFSNALSRLSEVVNFIFFTCNYYKFTNQLLQLSVMTFIIITSNIYKVCFPIPEKSVFCFSNLVIDFFRLIISDQKVRLFRMILSAPSVLKTFFVQEKERSKQQKLTMFGII